jgi:hypothetical protein
VPADDVIDAESWDVDAPGSMASGAPPRASDPSSGERLPARIDDPPYLPSEYDPHTYRPQLVLDPDEAHKLVESIKKMQRSVLVERVDYDRIPGTPKPSLLKPGAERLLQVFGLGHRMEVLGYDDDGEGKRRGVTYRCTVTKMMSDGREIVVSSCDGHASHDEAKWKNAPWNTVIKMAQKRALVGATLTSTATSGLFTQDMEDAYGEREDTADRPVPGPTNPDFPITKAQGTKLHALFGSLDVKDRDEKLRLCSNIIGRDLPSSKELTMGEAHSIINELTRREAARASTPAG